MITLLKIGLKDGCEDTYEIGFNYEGSMMNFTGTIEMTDKEFSHFNKFDEDRHERMIQGLVARELHYLINWEMD